jgi:hypothetical protein
MRSNTSRKFPHWKGCGQKSGVLAWLSVIRAVSTMNAIGSRNMMLTAIRAAWFPTSVRNRRRRTAGGIGRRVRAAAPAETGREAVAVAIGNLPGSGPTVARS